MNARKKAIIHGVPGDRARAAGIVRALWPSLTALFICGLCVGIALPHRVPLEVAGLGALAAVVLLALAGRRGLQEIARWFKGARGEERVAFLLAELPEGWHVFHDVPLAGGLSADHVVAGPHGVFVVETKCWTGRVTVSSEGTVLVDGVKPSRPPLWQTKRQANALTAVFARSMEEPPVCTPVLCFASETFVPGLQVCGDVCVCNGSEIVEWIKESKGHLTAEELERIVKSMEQRDEE